MVIWEIFGISVSSGQIKTHSFRLLQWVAQYQDLPSLKRYENLGFGAIWVRVGIRRNRRRNAHRTRAFVQCAEMQMSSLQHGEGCDCAAVKSCPGCQSWIIPRKGKASISRRGGGEGTSLWQDTQTWPALPLIRGIVEDTLHLKWMVLC